jgi:hypothetical protein
MTYKSQAREHACDRAPRTIEDQLSNHLYQQLHMLHKSNYLLLCLGSHPFWYYSYFTLSPNRLPKSIVTENNMWVLYVILSSSSSLCHTWTRPSTAVPGRGAVFPGCAAATGGRREAAFWGFDFVIKLSPELWSYICKFCNKNLPAGMQRMKMIFWLRSKGFDFASNKEKKGTSWKPK